MPKEIVYGFLQHRDIMNQGVTEQNVPIINRAITATLLEYSKQLQAILGLFSDPTTKFKFKYTTPAAKLLQGLDENGRARPTSGLGYYDVAFPIFSGGDAWGTNYVAEQKMKLQTINDWLSGTLTADKGTVALWLLKALFAKTPWVFDDPDHGDLTVQPLANGDSQEYILRPGSRQGATDSHLLGWNYSISDAHNPFPTIRKDLQEHPENGGTEAEIIVLAPSEQMDDIEGLAGFKEPPDWDLFPALTQSFLIGELEVPVPGTVRGKVNNCWIVEWPSLPASHLLAVPYGGGGDKALAQREHEEETLKGFFELPERLNSPFRERQFQRHTGFAAHNRVGALAMQIDSADYNTPTGYEGPVTS